MNAVIIYDEFDYATKAKATLERAAHRTDETTHWGVRLWRVDVLKLPLAAKAALAEAVEAHLIMVAVRQVHSLLPWLMDWLERWVNAQADPGGRLGRMGRWKRRHTLGCEPHPSCRSLPGSMA